VSEDGKQEVRGEKILIACGTRPAHIDGIPVDGQRIFDSDQVHGLDEIPRELIVVGAGIIGLEYASMFTALGVKVTLLDQRPTLLDFVDREIIESLCYQLRQLGTVFRMGEKVVKWASMTNATKFSRCSKAERRYAARHSYIRSGGKRIATG
jgi:NAD(P) transhydrogenase